MHTRWSRAIALLAALVLLGVAACAPLGRRAQMTGGGQNQLTLTGSSTVAPLALEIGKRFEQLHPGVRVDVHTGGSSRGIADARSGLADFGMVSRDLTSDEHDLFVYPIARDGVALIVHEQNRVESLSDEQIVAIYTGRIENWKEVGGRDAPIVVVNKAEGRSTLELFAAYFRLDPRQIEADIVIGDNEQGVKTVAGNPDAIGYVSIGTALVDRQHGVPIRLLPLGGVEPSCEAVARGQFPLSRTLHLVARSEPRGLAAQFLALAQSAAVRDLVEELKFVPLE